MDKQRQQQRRRILVTGASRGIGRAICDAIATAGHDVVGWSRSAPATTDYAARPIVEQRVDVGDPAAIAAAFASLAAAGIAIDGIVLNAGIGRWQPLRGTPAAQWRQTMDVNLDGAFHALQGALQAFDPARRPIVIGILSDSALYAFPDRAAYAASKAGLRALLETARREERARGVRFSLIYPSRVDTHFAGSREAGYPGMRPGGLPADAVADVVAYLLAQPPNVEIREVHMAALSDGFGPYDERYTPS